MTEPKRWQDEGAPAEFGVMFSAVRSEEPSAASLQRALTAAGALGAIATQSAVSTWGASGAAGGVAAKGTLFGLATKLIATCLVGAAAVGVTVGIVAHRRDDAARAAAEPAKVSQPRVRTNDVVQPNAPAVPAAREAIIDTSALPLVQTSVQVGTASGTRRANRTVASAESAESDASLPEQMALIDRARASLRAGNAGEALRSATDYRRKYAAGYFTPEALFLQMQASKQLGQMTLATNTARELVERFPGAPNVSRARELLQSQTASENP